MKEVVSEIQKHINGEVDIVDRRPGDPAFLVADNTKAGAVLSWKNGKMLADILAYLDFMENPLGNLITGLIQSVNALYQ